MERKERIASVTRTTKETDISLTLSLDSYAGESITTGVGFFDHMLDLFSRHGQFGLKLTAKGDLHIDAHHTVEDIGIALGRAFHEALGDKRGIARYGQMLLPMDESLVEVALDLGGRAFLHFDAVIPAEKTGDFDTALAEEFFRAFSDNAKMNLHIVLRHGRNPHHIIEGMFKAVARALRQAVTVQSDMIASTKGVLE